MQLSFDRFIRIGLVRVLASLKNPKSVYSGAIGVGLMTIVKIGATFLATTMLARLLGPVSYGLVALVISTVLLVSLPLNAGLPAMMVREVARNEVSGRSDLTAALYRWAGLWIAVGAILLVIPLCFYAGVMSSDDQLDYWGVLLIGLAIAPIYAFGSVNSAMLRGLRLASLGNFGESVARPLVLLAGAAILTSFEVKEARDVVILQLLSYAAFAVVAFVLFRFHRPYQITTWKNEYPWRIWLKAVLPFTFLALTIGVNNQVQALLIGVFADVEQNGLFAAASSISYFAMQPLMVMNLVVTPHIAKLYHASNHARLQRLTTRTARLSFLATLPIVIAFWLFGDLIVKLVFGSAYAGTFIPAAILMAGQLATAAAGPCGQLLNMTDNERMTVLAVFVGLISNLIVGILLVPRFGATGAAIASVSGTIIWNILMTVSARRCARIDSSILGLQIHNELLGKS